MTRNIIFDFGAVLVDWNPRHLYGPYFNDDEKTERFLAEVCTFEWNEQGDKGIPVQQITDERVAELPQWEKEIRMYFGNFMKMMGGQIPGMEELLRELKSKGYRLFGLSNWSAETFALVEHEYPIFSLLEGYVISGREHCVKPDAQIYRILLERYGLNPEECIFVDDREPNIRGGEAVGIKGIVFTSPEALREKLGV